MNYFNYFTEIETRFQQRRGSLLILSTLDWALIETWREAGVPLDAVLRGIDDAFDHYEAQRLRTPARRQRKINGLAWCAQSVLEAVEQSRAAAIGSAAAIGYTADQPATPHDSGFDPARIARFLLANAAGLEAAAARTVAAALAPNAPALTETAARLRSLAHQLGCPIVDEGPNPASLVVSLPNSPSPSLPPTPSSHNPPPSLEDLDRTLTVLEEKLFAALLTASPESQLIALREQAARELAPYRGKMQAVQIKQVQQQFLQKRLLEAHSLPRLSLFYMPHEDPA
jgi:hypothetical protein